MLIYIILCAGTFFWMPFFIFRCKSRRAETGALCVLAAFSLAALFAVHVPFISWIFFSIYAAVLYLLSRSLVSVARTWEKYIPPEAVAGTVSALLFAPAVICNPAGRGIFGSLILYTSPQVAVGDLCGINIFRTVYYGISPTGDYFILIPEWWKSALLFAAAAGVISVVRCTVLRLKKPEIPGLGT